MPMIEMDVKFLEQVGLALVELIPIAFSQAKTFKVRRFDCVFGLLLEPYWIYYAYTTKQWGILFLGFLFIIVFAYGFYHKWIIPYNMKKEKLQYVKTENNKFGDKK